MSKNKNVMSVSIEYSFRKIPPLKLRNVYEAATLLIADANFQISILNSVKI
jgi:hypothetical protein